MFDMMDDREPNVDGQGEGCGQPVSGVWTRAAARWKKGLAMVLERPRSVDGQNRQFHKM
jgi:hypothetical protein